MLALIEVGADVNKARNSGATPLLIAAHEGHLGCVRALCAVPGLLPDGLLPNASGISPAEAAAANGHAEVQAFLLIAANAAPSADSLAATGGNVDDEQDDAYESPFFPQSRRLSAAEAAGESADGSGQERRRTRTTDETEERDGGDDGSPAAKRTKR